MTPLEKRFLRRRVCALCEQRLDRDSCAALFSPRCSPELIAERRRKCLETYKPRPNRRRTTPPQRAKL